MSVTPEKYAKAVISDYSHEIKSEMKKAEKMAEKADRNRDGIVTEAEKQETIDEYMPGMKTLSKYR